MEERSIKLDVLKCIGLFFIILAHVDVRNDAVLEFRSFDVVLMVFVSGILAVHSYNKEKNDMNYIIKRAKRLLIPTYLFLTVYFVCDFLVSWLFSLPYYDFHIIWTSYLLLDGIGYVWIIRVYLLCAIVTPLMVRILLKLKMNYAFFVICAVWLSYEMVYAAGILNENILFKWAIWYAVPYGIVQAFAMVTREECAKKKMFLGVFFLLFWLLLDVYKYLNGESYSIRDYKYPPQAVYLSYGLEISFLNAGEGYRISCLALQKAVIFVSKNSLWIYLIHIAFLRLIPAMSNIHWGIQWIFISIASCLGCYVKNLVLCKFNRGKSGIFKYLEGEL